MAVELTEEQQKRMDEIKKQNLERGTIKSPSQSLKEGIEGEEKNTALSIGQIKGRAQDFGKRAGNAWHTITDKDTKHGINDYSEYKKYNKAIKAQGLDADETDNVYKTMADEGIINYDTFTKRKATEPDTEKFEKYNQAVQDIKDNFNNKLTQSLSSYMSDVGNSYQINAITKATDKMNTQFGMFVDNFADIYKNTRDDKLLEDFDVMLKDYQDDIIKFTDRRAQHLTTDNQRGMGAYYNTLNDEGMRQVANEISKIENKYENKFAQAAIKSNFGDSWEAFKNGNLISSVAELVGGVMNAANWVLDKVGNVVEETKQVGRGWYDVVEELNHLNAYSDDAGALEKSFGSMASWVASILDAAPTIAPAVGDLIIGSKVGTVSEVSKVGKVATKIDDIIPVIFKKNRELRKLWKAEDVITTGAPNRLLRIQENLNDIFLYDIAFQQFMGRPLTDDDIAANFLMNLPLDALSVRLGNEGLKAFKTTLEGDLVLDTISNEMYQMFKKGYKSGKSVKDAATEYFLGRSYETGKTLEKVTQLEDIKNIDEGLYNYIKDAQSYSVDTIKRITEFQPTGNDIIKSMQAELISKKAKSFQEATEFGAKQVNTLTTLLNSYPQDIGTKTTLTFLKSLITGRGVDVKTVERAINTTTSEQSIKKILRGILGDNQEQYEIGLKELEKNLGDISRVNINDALNNTLSNLVRHNPGIIQVGDVVNGYVKGADGLFRSIIHPEFVLSNEDFIAKVLNSNKGQTLRIGRLNELQYSAKVDDFMERLNNGEIKPLEIEGRKTQQYDVTELFTTSGKSNFGFETITDYKAAVNNNPKITMIDRILKENGFKVGFDEHGKLRILGGTMQLNSFKKGVDELTSFAEIPTFKGLESTKIKKNVLNTYKLVFAQDYAAMYKTNIDAINKLRADNGVKMLTSEEMKAYTKDYKTWLEELFEDVDKKSDEIAEYNSKVEPEKKLPDTAEVKGDIDTEVKEAIKSSLDGDATIAEVEKAATKSKASRTLKKTKGKGLTDKQIKNLLEKNLFGDPAKAALFEETEKSKVLNNMTDIINLFKDDEAFDGIANVLAEYIGVLMNTKAMVNLATSKYYDLYGDIIANIIYKSKPETQTALFAKIQYIMEDMVNGAEKSAEKMKARRTVQSLYNQITRAQETLKQGLEKDLTIIPAVRADRISLTKKVLNGLVSTDDFEQGRKLFTKEKVNKLKGMTEQVEKDYMEKDDYKGIVYNLAKMTDEDIEDVADTITLQQMYYNGIYSKSFYDNFKDGVNRAFKNVRDNWKIKDKTFSLWGDAKEGFGMAESPEFGTILYSTLLGHLRNTDLGYTSIVHEFRHKAIREARMRNLSSMFGKKNATNVKVWAEEAEGFGLKNYGGSFYAYILKLEDMLKEDVKALMGTKKEALSYSDILTQNYMGKALVNQEGKFDASRLVDDVRQQYSKENLIERLRVMYENGNNNMDFTTYWKLSPEVENIEDLINEFSEFAEMGAAGVKMNSFEINQALDILKNAGTIIDRFRIISNANANMPREKLEKQLLADYNEWDIMKTPSVYRNVRKVLNLFMADSDKGIKQNIKDFQKIINQANIEVSNNTTPAQIKKQVLEYLEHHRFKSKDTEKLQKLIDEMKDMDDDEVVVMLDTLNSINYTPYKFIKNQEVEFPDEVSMPIQDNVGDIRNEQVFGIKSRGSVLNYEGAQFTKFVEGDKTEIAIDYAPNSQHFKKTDGLMNTLISNQKGSKNVPLINAIQSMGLEMNTLGQQYIKLLTEYIGDESIGIDIRKVLIGDNVLTEYLKYFNNGGKKDFNTFCLNRLAANILSINGDYTATSKALYEMSDKARNWKIYSSINTPPSRDILHNIIDTRFNGLDISAETKYIYYNVPDEDGVQHMYAQLLQPNKEKKYYRVEKTKTGKEKLVKMSQEEGIKLDIDDKDILKTVMLKKKKVGLNELHKAIDKLLPNEYDALNKAYRNYMYAVLKQDADNIETASKVLTDNILGTINHAIGMGSLSYNGYAPKQLAGAIFDNMETIENIGQRMYSVEHPQFIISNILLDMKHRGVIKGLPDTNGLELIKSVGLKPETLKDINDELRILQDYFQSLPKDGLETQDGLSYYQRGWMQIKQDIIRKILKDVDKEKIGKKGKALEEQIQKATALQSKVDTEKLLETYGGRTLDRADGVYKAYDTDQPSTAIKQWQMDEGEVADNVSSYEEELMPIMGDVNVREEVEDFVLTDLDLLLDDLYGLQYDEAFKGIEENIKGKITSRMPINAGPLYLNTKKSDELKKAVMNKNDKLAGRLRNMDAGYFAQGGAVGLANKYGVGEVLGRNISEGKGGVVDKIMVTFNDGGTITFGKNIGGDVRDGYEVLYSSQQGLMGNDELGLIQSLTSSMFTKGDTIEVLTLNKNGDIISRQNIGKMTFRSSFVGKDVSNVLDIRGGVTRDIDAMDTAELRKLVGLEKGTNKNVTEMAMPNNQLSTTELYGINKAVGVEDISSNYEAVMSEILCKLQAKETNLRLRLKDLKKDKAMYEEAKKYLDEVSKTKKKLNTSIVNKSYRLAERETMIDKVKKLELNDMQYYRVIPDNGRMKQVVDYTYMKDTGTLDSRGKKVYILDHKETLDRYDADLNQMRKSKTIYLNKDGKPIKEELEQNILDPVAKRPIYKISQDGQGHWDDITNSYIYDEDVLGYELSDKWFDLDATYQDMLQNDIVGGPYASYYENGGNLNVTLADDMDGMIIQFNNRSTNEVVPTLVRRVTSVNPETGQTFVEWNLYFKDGAFSNLKGQKFDEIIDDMGYGFDRRIGLQYNAQEGWKETTDVFSKDFKYDSKGNLIRNTDPEKIAKEGEYAKRATPNQVFTDEQYDKFLKAARKEAKKEYQNFVTKGGDKKKFNLIEPTLYLDRDESVKSLTNAEHYNKYENRRAEGITKFDTVSKMFGEADNTSRILSLHNFDVIGNDPILVQLRGENKAFRAQFGEKLKDVVSKWDNLMEGMNADEQSKIIKNLKDSLSVYKKKGVRKIMTLNVPGVGKEAQDLLNDFAKIYFDAGWTNDVILSMINRPQSLDDIVEKTFNSDFVATLGVTGLRTKDEVRELIFNVARNYDKPKRAYQIAQDFVGDPLGTSKAYKALANIRDAYRFCKYSFLSPISGTVMYINSMVLGEPLLWGKKKGLTGFLDNDAFKKIVENENISNMLERADDIIANGNTDMFNKGLFVNNQLRNLANLVSKPGSKLNKILTVINTGGIHSLYDMQKSGDVRKYAFAQALKHNHIYETQLPDLLKKVESGEIFKEEYKELWNKILADTEEYYARFFSNGSTTATSRHKFSRAFGVNFLQGYVLNRTDEMIQGVRKFGKFLDERGVKNLTWADVTKHISEDNPEIKSLLNNLIFSAKAGYYLDRAEGQDGKDADNMAAYFVSTNDYLSSLDATFFYRILTAPLNSVKAYNQYNDMAGEKGTVLGGVKVATFEALSQICSQIFREGKFLNAISNTVVAGMKTGDLDFASTVAGVELDKMFNSLGRFGLVDGMEKYGLEDFSEDSDILGQLLLATDKTTLVGKEQQNIYDITNVDKWINNKVGDNAVTAFGYLPVVGEILKSITNKGGFGFTEAKYKTMMEMFDKDEGLKKIYNGEIDTDVYSDEAINRIYNDFTAFNYPYKTMKSVGKHSVGSYVKGEDTTLNSMKEDVFVENICNKLGMSIEEFHNEITQAGQANAKTTGKLKIMAAAEAAEPGSGKIVLSYIMANRLYELEKQVTGMNYPSTADVPEDVLTQLKRQVISEYAADEFVADRTSQYKVIREYVSEKNPEVFDTLYKNEKLSQYTASLGFLEMLVRQAAKDGDVNAKYIKNVFSVLTKYMINDEARMGAVEYIASVIDNMDAPQAVKDMSLEGVFAGNIDMYNRIKDNAFFSSTHPDVLRRFEERIWGVMDRVDDYDNPLTNYGKKGTAYTSQYGNGNKDVDDEFKKQANSMSPLRNGGRSGSGGSYGGGYNYPNATNPKGKDLDYLFKLYEALIKDYSDKLVKSEGKKYPAEKIASMTYKSGRSYGTIKPQQLYFPKHRRKEYSTKTISNLPGASG